jgi:MscS family membrane protein
MITIFGFEIALPQGWEILGNLYIAFTINILLAVILAIVFQIVVFKIIKLWTQNTEIDIDDVILGIIRYPLIFLIILLGLKDAVDALNMVPLTSIADKLFWAIVTLLLTYLVWKIVFKELLLYYGRKFAEESESSIDDILLPLANVVAPIIIILIGGLIFLQTLGVDISALAVVIGGASFILAFALQSTLTNVFSGISLLMDTPFKYGDIIVLSDGRVCEVKRIGLRITELYNTGDHSTIFMPNSTMADEMLVNITRPTPDLKAFVVVGVEPTNENLRRVPDILLDVSRANPYLLGNGVQNLDSMKARKEYIQKRLDSSEYLPQHFNRELKEIEWGLKMLKVQGELYNEIEKFAKDLTALSEFIQKAEKTNVLNTDKINRREKKRSKDSGRGLSKEEERLILDQFESINEKCQGVLLTKFYLWVNVRRDDPNLLREDREIKITEDAARRTKALKKRLKKLEQTIMRPSEAEEWRLDTLVGEFRDWISTEFMRPTQEWQLPFVDLNLGNYTYDYKLIFFVDDIQAERFQRLSRVLSDIKRRVAERLTEEGVNLPIPSQSVNLSGELQLSQPRQSGGNNV